MVDVLLLWDKVVFTLHLASSLMMPCLFLPSCLLSIHKLRVSLNSVAVFTKTVYVLQEVSRQLEIGDYNKDDFYFLHMKWLLMFLYLRLIVGILG